MKENRMRRIAAVVLAAACPCLAQEGLFGVSRSGELSVINTQNGLRWFTGNLGQPVQAAGMFENRLWVISPGDLLGVVDRVNATISSQMTLAGRPEGWTVTGLAEGQTQPATGLLVVMSPPNPNSPDWLFRVNFANGSYEPIMSTNIRDVEGVADLEQGYERQVLVLGRDGQLFALDPQSGVAHHETTLWRAGGPYSCLAMDSRGLSWAAGNDLWIFDGGDPNLNWRVVHWTGFDDIVGLAQFGQDNCYADCEAGNGLNVFDFLCFQNRFASQQAYACDCDISTGTGACDVFDFLCFQNAFTAGCQ
jgi:hypothetical protein